jgi:CRISPR-associated protein (Cas_Cmr5)
MNRIDKLLKKADAALLTHRLVDDNNILDDVFDGYLASFGATVIISGLIQTLAVYEADKKRKIVLNAIATVSAIEHNNVRATTGAQLLELCLNNHINKLQLNTWREKILDASVALKMMIRTYNFNTN